MKCSLNTIGKWLGTLATVGATSVAMALPVANGGFEFEGTGWTLSDPVTTGVGFDDDTANAIGTKSFRYTGSDTVAGRVSQSLTFQAGHDYSLRFLVRRSLDLLVAGQPGFPADTPELTVRLGQSLISLNDFDFDEPEDAGEFWWIYQAALGTPGGGDFELSFEFLGRGNAFLDEISVRDDTCPPGSTLPACVPGGGGGNNNDVPEPGSLLLVGAALAGLGLVRRRKTV